MDYRREVDGLRAVAVVPVVLFHAGATAFAGGFVGVDVFFVISGFLITSIIVKEREAGRFSLVGFYERRARRILPALFFVMLCCLLPALHWMPPTQLKDFSESLAAVALFGSNVLFTLESGYFTRAAEHSPLLHTWSLSVEEQFYVLFPLILVAGLGLGRRGVMAGLVAAGVASLALAQWASVSMPEANFYLLPTRAWELMAGAALALLPAPPSVPRTRDQWASLAGLGAILVAVFVFDEALPFPGVYALVPVAGAVLVIHHGRAGTITGRLLGSRLLVGIGLLSYSLYLWHQPLLAFARVRELGDPARWVIVTAVAATLPLAAFTWRFVEAPFRDRRRTTRREVFVLSGAGIALFLSLGVAGHVADGWPGRFDPAVSRLLMIGAEHRQQREDGCNNRGRDAVPKRCLRGDTSRPPDTALWGDSFASTLVRPLADRYREMGASYVQYTKNGCAPAVGVGTKPEQGCQAFTETVAAEIAASPVTTVILLARWQGIVENVPFDNEEGGRETDLPVASDVGDGLTEAERVARIGAGIRSAVESLLAAGKRVVLVYPVPEPGWDVPARMAKSLISGEATPVAPTTSLARMLERARRSEALLDAVGEHPGLTRVFPRDLFCDGAAGRCRTADGSEPLYYDTLHLSRAGARPVTDKVLAAIAGQPATTAHCGSACPASAAVH